MPDLFMTEDGDLTVSNSGDLAITTTPWRDYSQQAFIATMTPLGDFELYPELGADLEQLLGLPQSPQTAELGKSLIMAALNKHAQLSGKMININAVPTSLTSIRFDIYITAGSQTDLALSIEQNIGFE